MEEKVLIKSESCSAKKVAFGVLAITIVLSLIIGFALFYSDGGRKYMRFYESYPAYCDALFDSAFFYALEQNTGFWTRSAPELLLIVAFNIAVYIIVYSWLRSNEITVTDKRVYGRAAFGKRVDLPIDSVSAIGSKRPKGIAIATSSGKIAFLLIKNRDEIHKCVSDLLIERQSKTAVAAVAPVVKQEVPLSNAGVCEICAFRIR